MVLSEHEQAYTLKPALDKEVPNWLRRHADLWIQDPCVEAVVLFGSRTTGHADSYSDWDVAILHGANKPNNLVREKELLSQAVDLPVFPLETYLNRAHYVGSLAHEVAVHGRVLAGSVPTTLLRRLILSEEDLGRHLEYSFRYLAIAITDFHDVLRHAGTRSEPLESTPGRTAVAPSADGAERVSKALCVHLGIPAAHTHDIEQLADSVPKEWRDKVLDMNGNTHRAHLATCLDNPETLADVEKRISSSLRLLTQIIEPCCYQLSDRTLASLDGWVHNHTFVLAVGDYLTDQDIHPSVHAVSTNFDRALGILHREHLKRTNP